MKTGRRILSFLIALTMLLSMCVCVFAKNADDEEAEEKAETSLQNRYNVIFVTDTSGSMLRTDPQRLRYDAIWRFVFLMAQEGNYLGSVSFNEGLKAVTPLGPISGMEEKEAFMEDISSLEIKGDTNIGLALMEAVEMLDEDKNPDIPSVIILLTDGVTDLPTSDEMEESLEQKAEAIELAREAGYQIYTIYLADEDADASEMEQIASATGGQCQHVSSAKDLVDVQIMYYQMIFGAGDTGSEELDLDKNGYVEKEFDVPSIGVEEFNVLLEGKISEYSLTDPEGYTYSEKELKSMTMEDTGFLAIKVPDPIGGTWTASLTGEPGATIDFRLLYNADFRIDTSISQKSDYEINDVVTFYATLSDRRGDISDMEQYEEFSAQLHLTVNGEEAVLDMDLDEDGFYYDLKLEEEGTYYAYITAANAACEATSEKTYELNVNNRTPEASGETLTAHAYVWPFLGGKATLDLTGAATDPDGDDLTYSVESSAFMKDDYDLDGNELTVSNFSISKGSFTIRATDRYGAYCTFDVSFTSTNVGLIIALLLVVGILVTLIVIFLVIRHFTQIPFMGTINVEKHDNEGTGYSVPSSMTPRRGRIRLETFLNDSGLPKGCYFQAGGKQKCVYFVSKSPVFSDCIAGSSKKIKIDGSGLETLICTDSTLSKGIRVTFQSVLCNQFDF